MSIFNTQEQEEQQDAEDLLDTLINSLNSMRDWSSNPEKKNSRKIRQIKNEIKYIRDCYPEAEYCHLKNILFGAEIAEQFEELKEFL